MTRHEADRHDHGAERHADRRRRVAWRRPARRARPRWRPDPTLVGRDRRGVGVARSPCGVDRPARPRRLGVGPARRLLDERLPRRRARGRRVDRRAGGVGGCLARRHDRPACGRCGPRAILGARARRHHPPTGAGRRESHPRIHGQGRRRWIRDARRRCRRHRRVPATSTPSDRSLGTREEPPPRRGRPVALALGSRLHQHANRRRERACTRRSPRRTRSDRATAHLAGTAGSREAVRSRHRGRGRRVPPDGAPRRIRRRRRRRAHDRRRQERRLHRRGGAVPRARPEPPICRNRCVPCVTLRSDARQWSP